MAVTALRAKCPDYSLHAQGPRLEETATAFLLVGFMLAADASFMLWADGGKILTYTSRDRVPTLRARKPDHNLHVHGQETVLHARCPDYSLHVRKD